MSHTWRRSQLSLNIHGIRFPLMSGILNRREGQREKFKPVPLIMKSLFFLSAFLTRFTAIKINFYLMNVLSMQELWRLGLFSSLLREKLKYFYPFMTKIPSNFTRDVFSLVESVSCKMYIGLCGACSSRNPKYHPQFLRIVLDPLREMG